MKGDADFTSLSQRGQRESERGESRKENRKKHRLLSMEPLCMIAEAWAWVSIPGLYSMDSSMIKTQEKKSCSI